MLRKGFSSGTAVTAAAVGGLRLLVDPKSAGVKDFPVVVFLPFGIYFPVPVRPKRVDLSAGFAVTEVKKDGGDDPDITHGATFTVMLEIFPHNSARPGIYLKAGPGVGIVTREGLPVKVGEPAINPVPRQMLRDNIEKFLSSLEDRQIEMLKSSMSKDKWIPQEEVFIPFLCGNSFPFSLLITVSVPRGEVLAKKTLNPRLGIEGGLSILGTTGLVIPYSHEAYQETIVAALKFARTNGLDTVVFSTGGKSEKLAQRQFPYLPDAAFVQIADFYRFALEKAQELGFSRVIHSVFFGKLIKMAMGFPYTHAHFSNLNFGEFLKKCDLKLPEALANRIATANTARQVLDIIKEEKRHDMIEIAALWALKHSRAFAPGIKSLELVLFDYEGGVLFRRIEE